MKNLLMPFACLAVLVACGQAEEPTTTEPQTEAAPAAPAATDMPEVSGPMSEADKNLAFGRAYLDENKIKPGVITTTTGLQYNILASGDAAGPHPTPGQVVCVHYRGTSITGEEFDSSYSRNLPTAFPSNGVISGWVEALSLMRAGDKWKLVIPAELAYGARGTSGGSIGPNQTLVFEVELLKLLDISIAEYRTISSVDRSFDCSQG